MADTLRVNVGERAEELVDVQLDFEDGHNRLHLVEVARSTVHGLGNELKHEIQVHLVFLWLKRLATRNARTRLLADTYPLAVVVEEGLELDNVGMSDNAHNLEFAVLRGSAGAACHDGAQTHLEALVLQDTLDGRIFTTRRQLGLEDDTERAVADNLALRVCEVLVVAGQAVLDLFADNFCGRVSMRPITRRDHGGHLPPILSDEKADGRFWLIVWCYACGRGSGSAARIAGELEGGRQGS